jgi:hypothetical protein
VGSLRDTLIQHRDICGDFDYNKAILYDVQKFFDHQGISRGQQHYIMKLPLLPGETDCFYDRMITIAVDFECKATEEQKERKEINKRKAEMMLPSGMPGPKKNLTPSDVTQDDSLPPPINLEEIMAMSEAHEKQKDKDREDEDAESVLDFPPTLNSPEAQHRSNLIEEHIFVGARRSVYMLVCFMETQMCSVQPPVFRMSLFNHEGYKKWWKTVDWMRTHLPRKFQRIPTICSGIIPSKYVDGRVVYHNGSIDHLRARLCYMK